MKPQQPAQGISLDSDFGSAKCYTITCDCHDPDHGVHMWIEVEPDKDVDEVAVTFYVNTVTPFWKNGYNRFKAAWNILVNGYQEDQHSLVLNKQAALNVASAITSSIEQLEKKV